MMQATKFESNNMTTEEIKTTITYLLYSIRNNPKLTATVKNKSISLISPAYSWIETGI